MLVPGLKRSIFSSWTAAQKGVKTVKEKSGSYLRFAPFSVQLTRFDDMDHLDITIAKESRRTKSSVCASSGKMFGKESVLKVLVLTKPTALSVDIINIDSVEDKNNNSPYKIHGNTYEEVRFCEQVESNTQSPTIDDTNKKGSKGGSYGNKILYKNLKFFDKIFVTTKIS